MCKFKDFMVYEHEYDVYFVIYNVFGYVYQDLSRLKNNTNKKC